MSIKSQTTTPLQIFCELLLYSKVLFKNIKVADDAYERSSECEWVKNGKDIISRMYIVDGTGVYTLACCDTSLVIFGVYICPLRSQDYENDSPHFITVLKLKRNNKYSSH